LTIGELRQLALRRLPRFLGDYIEQGAGDGETVRRNIDAFRSFAVRPRSLIDVRVADTSTEVFGRSYVAGFGLSAVGAADIFRPRADEMLARSAEAAGAPFILSGTSFAAIEKIVGIAPNNIWYQLYGAATPELTDEIVARVGTAGVQTLVYTVDAPVPMRSLVAQRSGASLRSLPSMRAMPRVTVDALMHPRWTAAFLCNGGIPRMESWAPHAGPVRRASDIVRFFQQHALGGQVWDDLERIRRNWRGSLVVKGLVHPDDVARAWNCGADAITISNHGGNKLDCMEGALRSLAHVRASVDPGIKLFFDGGIRRGSDIVIAKALGADFCFVGRATLYGVIAGGLPGAARAIELLESDLRYTLTMIGRSSLASVSADDVVAYPDRSAARS
jgi:L-lactate dehydrogenase (cytochrome)/(S)-mandelate dehydrogenase